MTQGHSGSVKHDNHKMKSHTLQTSCAWRSTASGAEIFPYSTSHESVVLHELPGAVSPAADQSTCNDVCIEAYHAR